MLTNANVAATMNAAWIALHKTVPEADFAASKRAYRMIRDMLAKQLYDSMAPFPGDDEAQCAADDAEEFKRDCNGNA